MDKIEILLKDYEIMRTEVRLYINKYYLAVAVMVAIISAGIFQVKEERLGLVCVFVPYMVAAGLVFFAMLTFYVNKTAGYVRLIEARISRMTKARLPEDTDKVGGELAPLFWESFYADKGLDRDKKMVSYSMYAPILRNFGLVAIVPLYIVLEVGYTEISGWKIMFPRLTAIAYVLSAASAIVIAIICQRNMEYNIRDTVRELNRSVLDNYTDAEAEMVDSDRSR